MRTAAREEQYVANGTVDARHAAFHATVAARYDVKLSKTGSFDPHRPRRSAPIVGILAVALGVAISFARSASDQNGEVVLTTAQLEFENINPAIWYGDRLRRPGTVACAMTNAVSAQVGQRWGLNRTL